MHFVIKRKIIYWEILQGTLSKIIFRATSAAPFYFTSTEVSNITGSKNYVLCDGGMGKNDPTFYAFNEVIA